MGERAGHGERVGVYAVDGSRRLSELPLHAVWAWYAAVEYYARRAFAAVPTLDGSVSPEVAEVLCAAL